MILYHGGTDIVEMPRIILNEQGRDFGFAFYATDIYEQALKWAKRQGRIREKQAVLNIYEFNCEEALTSLNSKRYEGYSLEWLELVVNCRANPQFKHDYDLVFGKIADDDVGETVQAVVDGLMPFDFALQKLTFMQANNQYAFCSQKALNYIRFCEFQNVG
jgi:hypothetical protein